MSIIEDVQDELHRAKHTNAGVFHEDPCHFDQRTTKRILDVLSEAKLTLESTLESLQMDNVGTLSERIAVGDKILECLKRLK